MNHDRIQLALYSLKIAALVFVFAVLFMSYEPAPEPAGYPPETMFEDGSTELTEEEEEFERSLVEEE